MTANLPARNIGRPRGRTRILTEHEKLLQQAKSRMMVLMIFVEMCEDEYDETGTLSEGRLWRLGELAGKKGQS